MKDIQLWTQCHLSGKWQPKDPKKNSHLFLIVNHRKLNDCRSRLTSSLKRIIWFVDSPTANEPIGNSATKLGDSLSSLLWPMSVQNDILDSAIETSFSNFGFGSLPPWTYLHRELCRRSTEYRGNDTGPCSDWSNDALKHSRIERDWSTNARKN